MDMDHQAVPRVVPTGADWSRLRTTVAELYLNRGATMVEVCEYLESFGYRVNTRMVRARISQWNLQRNHQLRDMAAALRLLDPDPAKWPSQEPNFLIRGRIVTLREVLHYFRRKRIQNPSQWVWSREISREANGKSDVTLLEAGSSGETTPVNSRITSPASSSQPSDYQDFSLPTQVLTLEQKAVASLHSYCLAYIGLGIVDAQQEPPVHQNTSHGKFGNHMKDGLAHMMRGGRDAFPKFQHGFDLVQPLLSDCHPVSLAFFLAVVCDLAAYQAQPILSSLLRHSAMMAASLRISSPMIEFLLALRVSRDVLGVAISSLRAALGAFTAHQTPRWQQFYIQERLCDCLYHGKDRIEGSFHRAKLFQDQDAFYGSHARNVLFTLANVADDYLYLGDLDGAKAHFTMVLTRAEPLLEVLGAKIRFAALEGLARTEQMRAESMSRQPLGTARIAIVLCLQESQGYINEALHVALANFETSSRHVTWIMEQQRHVSDLLASLVRQSPPPPAALL